MLWDARRRAGPLVVLAGLTVFAQRGLFQRDHPSAPTSFPTQAEFHFIRLEYTDLPEVHRFGGFASRSGRGSGWWMMDWPDADDHFSAGVARLTRVQTGAPLHHSLMDSRLFDHPWIYATQAGWWSLSDAECARLREFLLRGGFLVVDDFWGPAQWDVFQRTMQRVFPGQTIDEIDPADPVMHVVYDIGERQRTFVPGTRHLRRDSGGAVRVMQPEGAVPAWRAIRDQHNHLIVAINFNTDIGDAWEYADWPEYPEAMTTFAYRLGLNYLVYSMTH